MSVYDWTDTECVPWGEHNYIAQCDGPQCSEIVCAGGWPIQTEQELIETGWGYGFTFASTEAGDTGIAVCAKHTVAQALLWYGYPESPDLSTGEKP